MPSYRSYYDIEVIENDGIEELRDANKLYFTRGSETENVIEFTMPRTFGSIFSILVKDIVNMCKVNKAEKN